MKKCGFTLFLFILLLMTVPSIVFADTKNGKFILVIIDHLTLEDLQKNNLPNLNKIIAGGGLGLINTNTAGSRTPENTYSTVACGVRAVGTAYAGFAFNREEQVQLNSKLKPQIAKDLYQTINGKQAKEKVLHLGLPKMEKANAQGKNDVKLGTLGATLKSNGIRGGVFGSSDGFEKSRLASLFVIDELGRAEGTVDASILKANSTFPSGTETDYAKLKKEIQASIHGLDYLVIETGDTSRLEEYRDFLTPAQYKKLKAKILKNIDSFVGDLSHLISWGNDRLLIISPTPSTLATKNNNTVTPVIYKGGGIKPGIISSNSTRRQGIAAITDIAPTVLSYWEIQPPPVMVGRPLYSTGNTNTFEQLQELNKQLVLNYNHRPPVLKTFVILQIIYILLTAIIILFSKSRRIIKLVSNIAIIFLILPLMLLVYKIFRTESLTLTIALLVLIVTLIYKFITIIKLSWYFKIALLTLLTSSGILIDTLTGSNLVMNSPLGYDALTGARYYGIGNEFTGILMGSTIIGFAAVWQGLKVHGKWLFPFTVLYFIFLIYILYSPNLGADAGGLIVAVISLGFFSLRLTGKKISKKDILLLFIASFILLSLGAFIDLFLNQSKGSHIGQAFSLLINGNWLEVGNIISRKIAMNIKLMNYSIWTKVLLTSLIALGILLYRPVGFFKRLEFKSPYLKKGIEAAFIASAIGFAVNDSGIVQAATTFIYLIFTLLQLSLMDKLKSC